MISICITTTDMRGRGVAMLDKLVHSICQQYYKEWEIIVSDDSQEYNIYRYCQAVNFIKYVHNGSRGKSSINMNNAMKHATGDIIKPMFLDDCMGQPSTLSYIAALMKHSHIRWAVCRSSNHQPRHPMDIQKMVESENVYGCPSVFVLRKSAHIQFDENLVWLMDTEFCGRMILKYGFPFLLHDVTIDIGTWPGSITNTVKRATKKAELEHVRKVYTTEFLNNQ